MNIDEYKYVIQVVFENATMYYNSGSYCLVSNPFDALRYKYNDTESVIEDKDHACSQGGEGSVVLFNDAKDDFSQKKLKN